MRKYRTSVAAISLGLLSATGAAWADDAPAAPAKPAGPTLTDILTNSGLTLTGYVDASYDYLTNAKGQATFAPTGRVFDTTSDGFIFNQTGVTVAMQPTSGFGFLVNALGGVDANAIPSGRVLQAFIQYATGPLTVIGGKFATLAGAEVVAPTGNTNISRGFLFALEPLTHTGLRATYAASDKVSWILGVNNGWNNETDNNTSKTVEAGVSLTPSKTFAFTAQAYYGGEATASGAISGNRTLVDAVATWTISPALTLVDNFDWGQQEKDLLWDGSLGTSKYYGDALYLNWTINDQWMLSLRAEYLDDQDGGVTAYTGVKQKLDEGTVTFNYTPTKNFVFRLEGRYDKSSLGGGYPAGFAYFREYAPGSTTQEFSDNQSTVAIEGLYKF